MDNIRERLEKFYQTFDFEKAVKNDPIQFPKRYSDPKDIEVAAIISSSFAYGNIKCFCDFLKYIFDLLGKSPFDFIMNFKLLWLKRKLDRKYRFSTTDDIVAFFYIIKNLLGNSPSKSIKYYFRAVNNPFEFNGNLRLHPLVPRIYNFISCALKIDLSPVYGKDIKTHGLKHFFPNPVRGSSCKRINLFIRWMTRKRDVDFGLWNEIKTDELIVPLDIHIWRVARKLKLTKRNTQDLKTAIEITDNLLKIEPEDPLKYDFVLCHGDINLLL